jgi:hypothetical protein
MTVSELLDRMDASELTEWAALYQIEASEHEQAANRARAKSRMR